MINIQNMFWSLAEYGKDYICGNDPIPEFNSKVNEAQRMLFDMIAPEYDRNERIRTILEPFTRIQNVTANAQGVIAYPADMYRVLGGRYTQGLRTYPIYYAKENEIIESDFIPQRKASLTDGRVYITYVNGNIQLTPKTALTFDMSYLAKPSEVKLVYDYTVAQEAYMTLDTVNTVHLQWNNDAYNLILSILLLKYSLITKDQFKTEIASYGINVDLINAP